MLGVVRNIFKTQHFQRNIFIPSCGTFVKPSQFNFGNGLVIFRDMIVL